MRNLLREAANVLQDRMEEHASEFVTYISGKTGKSVQVPAVLGQTLTEEQTGEGYTIRITSRDFIIRQSNLPDGKPSKRDAIKFDGKEYLVHADAGESHVLSTDAYDVAWRIHTKINDKS